MSSDQEEEIRQTLMRADEVYLYKIPPLKTSGGHRAEDWNLSQPLQTCSFLAEQVGHKLVLSFYTQGNDAKLFAESSIDVSKQKDSSSIMQHWLEQVVDSSRYFAVKIQGAGNREATIGFGFRDREQATDLRECLQHYEKSIKREAQAASLSGSYSLPKLAEGEKIHVDRKSGKSTKVKKSSAKGGDGGVPLLRKPPPSPPESSKPKVTAPPAAAAAAQKKKAQKMVISMGEMNLNDDDGGGGDGGHGDDSSGGAVYEGDETQWATEFDMK